MTTMPKQTFIKLMTEYLALKRNTVSTRGEIDGEDNIDGLFLRAMEASMGDTEKQITEWVQAELGEIETLDELLENIIINK